MAFSSMRRILSHGNSLRSASLGGFRLLSPDVLEIGHVSGIPEEHRRRRDKTLDRHALARFYSTTTLRPLSPHLTIFKPQLNSTVSISNRISAALLVTVSLSSYLLYLKVGGVCFTFPSFYQIFFYSSKYLAPVTTEVTALALAFHLFYGIRHLITK